MRNPALEYGCGRESSPSSAVQEHVCFARYMEGRTTTPTTTPSVYERARQIKAQNQREIRHSVPNISQVCQQHRLPHSVPSYDNPACLVAKSAVLDYRNVHPHGGVIAAAPSPLQNGVSHHVEVGRIANVHLLTTQYTITHEKPG
jgi:hypothetical protein